MSIRIIPFEPRYARIFKALNVAWLERYFYVESKDKILLEDCKRSIIDKGGHIFFAETKGNIVGCFALIKLNAKVYELGKMAVDTEYQGLKIGQKLMDFAIEFARDNHWKKIVLYSHTKLGPAIYIYKKYGFEEVRLEDETPYKRSNIKMELILIE